MNLQTLSKICSQIQEECQFLDTNEWDCTRMESIRTIIQSYADRLTTTILSPEQLATLQAAEAWLNELADDGDCADWVVKKHREVAESLAQLAVQPTPLDPVVAYFGCLGSIGHYWHTRDNTKPHTPWGNAVDGLFQDSKPGVFRSAIAFEDLGDSTRAWTLICCTDRTVDRRPGSHSTFVASLTHAKDRIALIDPRTLLQLAQAQWPTVFQRFAAQGIQPSF